MASHAEYVVQGHRGRELGVGKIRLLCADDHEMFRQGAKMLLSDHPDFLVAAEASNYEEVMSALKTTPVDVVILDITMPGRNGIEVLEMLNVRHPEVRTIVLTMHAAQPYVSQALRAGAKAYMTKEHAVDELATVIRRVAAGGRYLSPSIADRMAQELAQRPEEPATHLQLSTREHRILEMLLTGMRGSDIAIELKLSEKSVSSYKISLLKKLGLRNTSDLVLYAIRHDLIPPS